MGKKTSQNVNDHFFQRFLNSKFVIFLLITLLISLITLILSQLNHLFFPIQIIINIIGPPVIFSAIFFYLLNPLVNRLETRNIPRKVGFFLLLVVIGILFFFAVYLIFPIVERQIQSMIEEWPLYWNRILIFTEGLINSDVFSEIINRIQESNILTNITNQANEILNVTVGGISSFIGITSQVVITIVTAPIILYYFIIDGKKIPQKLLNFVPTDWRGVVSELLTRTHQQLSFDIRGQLLVAFSVAIMFWIGFGIIGLEFGLVLAIVAGVLNLIPYLGSILASIPALIIGLVDSPLMFIYVVMVIAVEQFLEGRVVQPLVLGNQLHIHPVTIIFILLIAGRLFGLVGIILAVPGYAVIKIVVSMTFNYFQEYSALYYDKEKNSTDVKTQSVDQQNE